nr:hypothetical protein [Tanacetum cinerariifolium]
MANTTPIMATVTKTANKENTPKEADAALKVNILDFCEGHYKDILLVIMDKIRREKRKEVHARLDFEENPKKSRRVREGSQNSSVGTLPASMKRGREGESPLSRVSKSGTGDGGHWKTRAKRCKPADKEDVSIPWTCEDRSGRPLKNLPSCSAGRTLGDAYMVPHVQLYLNRGCKGLMDGETIEEFMKHFKTKTRRMKRAPKYMRISRFMHGVNNPKLTKRLNEHVPNTVEEMMTATMAFIQGETAAASNKKVHTPWKSQDLSKRQTSERKSDFRNQPKGGRGSNKFTPLIITPKEIFAAESGKFKSPPPKVTPIEKRSSNKFYDFHNDNGHSTDECVHIRKQIEYLSFAHVKEITFPPLTANKGTGGPLVIEAKIDGHVVHRIYVDGGSSMEVLYEHCFNRLWPEIKSQMVSATTSLTGFSGETIWPLGQLRLLVTIADAEHYTKERMNFMIVRSPSSYNSIIGRPKIREIQAVPSTAHATLKFLVNGEIVTIRSTILTPTECATIAATPKDPAKKAEVRHKNFKVATHPDFPDQKITIGGAKKRAGPEARQGNPSRGAKISRGRNSARSILPQLVIQPGHEMDWNVESLCGYHFKYRLDAYKGYHQIQMAEQDEEKTAFHTSHGAFKQLKQHLAKLPMMVAPKLKEELIMYLSASYGAISAVLLTERDTVQTSVYFVSRALQAPKLNYTLMEKPVLALVCATKRLHRYFQTHPIVVITDQPIKQILADFLVEKPDDAPPEASVIETPQESWTLFTDGSSCVDGSGVGLIVTSLEGTEFTYALRFQFTTSNNEAEYEALIAGLRIAAQMGGRNVHGFAAASAVLKPKHLKVDRH